MKKQIGRAMDMTRGGIPGQILRFAVPLLLGELFQQLYNTADSIIVGNFVGKNALAAVGATSSIVKLLVGFFMGISIGCTVVTARCFGAKDDDGLKKTVHTIICISLLLGVALSAVGVLATNPLLRMLNTPADVFPLASLYIRIYFGGMPGLVMYNTGTGILRAVGDSFRPFAFLLFSSLLNVALDLLFVVRFHMGVDGVAYATVLSQAISAILVLAVLMRSKESFAFRPREMRIHWATLRDVLRIGFPTAIQKSLTQYSNVIVLSYIAYFGSSCMAGWAVYSKINSFFLSGLQSISSSVTTFVGQNYGAKNYARAQTGTRIGFALGTGTALLAGPVVFCFAKPIAGLFGDDPEMRRYAVLFLQGLAFFQCIHGMPSIFAGALRGMGRATAATINLLLGTIVLRRLYLAWIVTIVNTPLSVAFSYPVGWLSAGIMMYAYYRYALHRDRSKPCNPALD